MSGERVGYGVSDEDLDYEERSEEQVRDMIRDRLEAKLGGDSGGAAVLEAVGDPSGVDVSRARWLTRSEEGDRDVGVLLEACFDVVEDHNYGPELKSASRTVANALAHPLGYGISGLDGEDGLLSPKGVLESAYSSTHRGLDRSVGSKIYRNGEEGLRLLDAWWERELSSLRDLAGDLQRVRDSGVGHSPFGEGAGAGMLERLSAPESGAGAADGRSAWGMGDASREDARQVFDAFRDSVEGMSGRYCSTAAWQVVEQLERGIRESASVDALMNAAIFDAQRGLRVDARGHGLGVDDGYWQGRGAPYEDLGDAESAIGRSMSQMRQALKSGDRDEFLAGVEAARGAARAVDGYRELRDA